MKRTIFLTIIASALFIWIGCSSSNNPTNPLSSFSPEIINDTNAFQFQITNATNVNTTVTYYWENTNPQATVDHSTVTTQGSAVMTVSDADTTQVYTSALLASGNEPTTSGTAGTWIISITFTNFSGTSNFRLETL